MNTSEDGKIEPLGATTEAVTTQQVETSDPAPVERTEETVTETPDERVTETVTEKPVVEGDNEN